MAVPKFSEFFKPVLQAIADGSVHEMKGIMKQVASSMTLSQDDLAVRTPNGTQTVFYNRVSWAKTYLKKAALLESPKRGCFLITDEGKKLLESGTEISANLLAVKYPSFAQFHGYPDLDSSNSKDKTKPIKKPELEPDDSLETPQEMLDRAYKTINDQLSDELLTEIMSKSPAFFENLVVDLMSKMGYGEGFVTKQSADDGIDGIITEDKLGFSLIYIQAKRWQTEKTVGKPEIQKFVGAMAGPPRVPNGLFITTAQFSKGAQEYAAAQHIILVDGQRLTKLMIEYGLGVSTQRTFAIKRIDMGYFEDDLD